MRSILRAAVLSVLLVPWLASADALPPDPNDPYYHCTPAEQCPQGSDTCKTQHLGAGRIAPDPACASGMEGRGLEQRCAGSGGFFLYCPKGATGSWKASAPRTTASPPPPAASGAAPRRGCS